MEILQLEKFKCLIFLVKNKVNRKIINYYHKIILTQNYIKILTIP